MKIKIEIDCYNAAFDILPNIEIARILKVLAEKLESGTSCYSILLKDINGNTVGIFEVEDND